MRLLILLSLLVLVEGSALGQAERSVLQGRVVGPDGKAVPGAQVIGTFEWSDSQSTFLPERVTADGKFTIRVGNAKDPRAIRVYAYAPDPNAIEIMRQGPPMENETANDQGEVVFDKSSMDRFTLSVAGAKDKAFRFADVRGTIVLTTTAK